MRSGFSLVEVVIALVIFQFGMLALTAVSAVSARDVATANRIVRARMLARNRVELLRAGACPAAVVGSATAPGGVTEVWRVEAAGATRIISDSVAFPMPGGREGNQVFRAWAMCAA